MASQSFEVVGGRVLQGDLYPQGAKNEALQILCAVIMTKEKVTISNLPEIVDVLRLIDLLKGLGVKVNRLNKGTYSFEADKINLDYVYSEEFQLNARKIRGSVMLIGALLGMYGKAYLPKPGGDKIGRRRIDTHFLAFEKIGAKFEYDKEAECYFVSGNNLKGGYVLMDEISVTGTANIIMAAIKTKGITTVYNAACEPYIQQLSKMLNSMGAKIEGAGSNRLTITGVDVLHGTEHRINPDMIEIGSFIGLAVMTKSDIVIKDVCVPMLGNILTVFRRIGIRIDVIGDDLYIPPHDHYEIQSFIDGSIMTIYDSPWPGFTPDLMSIILVTAIQAKGSILIHQKMFESRLFFVDKLIDMGAKIILCDPHRATVIGLDRASQLRAITMSSPDIRAGVSLLIAALSAKGTSTIHNINQIDRGYEDIEGRLNAIGAKIKRIKN